MFFYFKFQVSGFKFQASGIHHHPSPITSYINMAAKLLQMSEKAKFIWIFPNAAFISEKLHFIFLVAPLEINYKIIFRILILDKI